MKRSADSAFGAVAQRGPAGVSGLLFGLMLLVSTTVDAQQLQVVDRPVESFETDLAIHRNYSAQWIDNNQLVTTALAKGAAEDVYDKPRLRAVLVNYATRSIKVVQDGAAVLDADADGANALIRSDDNEAGARQVAINGQGEVSELRRFGPGEQLPLSWSDSSHKGRVVQLLRRKQDGYLYVEAEVLREMNKRGEPSPTEWARPDKPPMSLPVIFTEIGAVTYVRHLGKYLLNDRDSQMSSNTNGALNQPARWNRPYALAPYRLLSLDGTVEEIPYPKFVSDYGLGKFEQLRITRAGILISQLSPADGALYLYQGNQLYRLTAAGNGLGKQGHLPLSGVQQLSLSPDGCRIAYQHYAIQFSRITALTPSYLAILEVCKETK